MSETAVIRRMRREDLDAVTAIEAATFAIPWGRESFRQEQIVGIIADGTVV